MSYYFCIYCHIWYNQSSGINTIKSAMMFTFCDVDVTIADLFVQQAFMLRNTKALGYMIIVK